jgi:thioredoxin reductase (NADPH)
MYYDLIIIGAGSAGLPAAMYASRYKISNLVIGELPGGALATSHQVENWPGVLSASGKVIMDTFADHARHFGSEILQDRVSTVAGSDGAWEITTLSGKSFTSSKLLLGTGNKYRRLGVAGEERLIGAGVSYCATCDGNFFKNKIVAMVGGGDAAITESLYLADLCAEVHILVRGGTLRAETVWVEQIKKRANVTLHYNTQVEEIKGEWNVEELLLKNGETMKVHGIFIAVGSDPDTKLIDHLSPAKDDSGCIVVDKRQATSIPGLYAAGDVTTNSNKFKQTIMSAAEGCLAANSIHEDMLRSGHSV